MTDVNATLGFWEGYNSAKDKIRSRKIEDARLADAKTERERQNARQDRLDNEASLERADAAARQKKADERNAVLQGRQDQTWEQQQADAAKTADKEGLFAAARVYAAGGTDDQAAVAFNSVGLHKIPKGSMTHDKKTGVLQFPDTDGKVVSGPLDAILAADPTWVKERSGDNIELSPGAQIRNKNTGKLIATAPFKPFAPGDGDGGGFGSGAGGGKAPTEAQLLRAEHDAIGLVASQFGGKYDSATERLIDPPQEVTDKMTVATPIISKLTRKYAAHMGPGQIAAMASSIISGLPTMDELKTKARVEQTGGSSMFLGKYPGDDEEAQAAVDEAAKKAFAANLATLGPKVDSIMAEKDQELGIGPAVNNPVPRSAAQQPAVTLPPAALRALKPGKVTKFANGTQWTLKNGKPVQVK